ncbi:MAG TPA: hypothetical protein VGL13_12935, partial [Polyangiaceae bacterium]
MNMPSTAERHDATPPSMAELQGATPPPWRGRGKLRLLADVIGGFRQNWDKLVQLASLLVALFRPGLVRARLERLRALGHIDVVPTVAQLLVAARDQMIVSASAETKLFYQSQSIPWVFHNVRRFISGPATVLDPVGLFAPRDAIVHHVLQTFHRHPVYDFVLLRAHERGVEEMEKQAAQIAEGVHPHQRALASLVEDGSYHARLVHEVAEFRADPRLPARPIPEQLLSDPYLMLAMDQFKDIRGYTRYASRLKVGWGRALAVWWVVAYDESLGYLVGKTLGPTR